MRRRNFLVGAAAAPLLWPRSAFASGGAIAELTHLERETGGRLGVFVKDTGNGKRIAYRANERFPMCSTFKLLLVAAVLARVDRGDDRLDRRVTYTKAQLLSHAPIAENHVARGYMTISELCTAAIEYSDNTSANLLLASIGGPPGYTAYARSLGDSVTRLDRTEPALNSCIPGDPRDTTVPAATAADMQRVLLGSALSHASRARLIALLEGNTTGDTRLRAGLPHSWVVGDKTGTGIPTNDFGDSDTANDIAIAWPPNRAPLIITVYLTQSKLRAAQREAAIASVGRLAAETFNS
jgi:beta-lactamase class A